MTTTSTSSDDALETQEDAPTDAVVHVPFRRYIEYFLHLGLTGWGGPIAVIGYMQRDLVDKRRWISEQDFLDGVALGQTLPGPLGAQVAVWVGYLRRGALGALLVAIAFILPSALIVGAVAVIYAHYQYVWQVTSAFHGITPVVMAIMGLTCYRLLFFTNKDRSAWGISAVVFVVTAATQNEPVELVVAAGLLMMFVKARPEGGWRLRRPRKSAMAQLDAPSRLPGLAAPVLALGPVATGSKLWSLVLFFLKVGAFTFGFGLASVPVMHSGVVDHYHWLNERQFIDSVGVGLVTPGPAIIGATFIGYLVAGPLGAILATAATFTPIYLAIVIPGRWFVRYRDNKQVKAFVKGATAAAAGALAGMVVALPTQFNLQGPRDIIGMFVMTGVAVTLLLVFKKRAPEPLLVLLFGIMGIAAHI
jgi:chromate transporter